MKKCWEPSPKVRPSFKDIELELEAYLEQRSVRRGLIFLYLRTNASKDRLTT